MTYLMNEKICQHCSHKDVCYMYKDIREGKKWYKEYFGEDVLCPYLYNHMTTMTNMFNVVERHEDCTADVIVFEHLDRQGRKRGSKKQRLHLWKSQDVQRMVTDKAHRFAMRVSHICAWNTSKLAYDGSGVVLRGKDADLKSYSVCQFPSGKIYNCDLSASYNIGSRYFIREILKSLSARTGLALEAKVPQVAKRSTCTLSTLISLNAALASV